MRSALKIVILSLVILCAGMAQAGEPLFARMDTDAGSILLVFYPELAPHHVNNFVHLSQTGFYEGTKFHRIIPGFMIQGGDPNSKDADPRNDGQGGPKVTDVLTDEEVALLAQINDSLEKRGYGSISDSQASLKAEFSKSVKHLPGSLSMARSRDVDSAGSQFFVCVAQTPQLDGQYTVFGQVVKGQEVADTIVNAEKNPAAGQDFPAVPVSITRMTIIEGVGDLTADEKAAWDAMPDNMKNRK